MRKIATIAACLLAGALATPWASAEDTLRVVTTTTDLREIAKAVGGDRVEVDCLTKGPEDAHYLRARPSMIRAAASADMLVITGRDLEIGTSRCCARTRATARSRRASRAMWTPPRASRRSRFPKAPWTAPWATSTRRAIRTT